MLSNSPSLFIIPGGTPGGCGFFISAQSLSLAGIFSVKHVPRCNSAPHWHKKNWKKEKNEELIQAKLQFFANISHEFRTPLTLIIAQLEALLQVNSLSPFLRSRLTKIYRNTFQFKELISELLDFRKMERGKLHLNVCQMDLIPYLRQIHQDFTDQANLQNIQFIFHTEAENLLCWFDGRQLRKVLTNLLSNAFKHTPEKGKIELSITDKGDSIYIKVIDSGKGIPLKGPTVHLRPLLPGGRKLSSPGSGIGLALSKGIVELHHGQIEVQSAIDYGSIFTVILPKENLFKDDNDVTFIEATKAESATILAPFTETTETEECAETPEPIFIERTDKDCVLIVEDNEELLQLLTDLLSPLYRIVIAMNGKDGLQKAMEERPDLILSDVMMPEMDGIEMCSKIKTDFDLCHTPRSTAHSPHFERQKVGRTAMRCRRIHWETIQQQNAASSHCQYTA